MLRKLIILALPIFVLVGCNRPIGRAAYGPADLSAPPPPAASDNQSFSYLHTLALEMPRKSIQPHYEKARESCLHEIGLACKLVSSSIELSSGQDTSYSAQLVVALPHDKVAAYERDVLARLSDETADDVLVTSRSTTAQNITRDEEAASRKVAQLSDYRERLQELAKRSGLSVDDLIKVESELSKTQGALDDALSQKSDADDRIAREQVTIFISERAEPVGPFDRVGDVGRQSVQLFGESTANMLQFLIQVIPWLPIIAVMFFLARWLWRIARRRNSVANSRSD
jgi:hypothetical protein